MFEITHKYWNDTALGLENLTFNTGSILRIDYHSEIQILETSLIPRVLNKKFLKNFIILVNIRLKKKKKCLTQDLEDKIQHPIIGFFFFLQLFKYL